MHAVAKERLTIEQLRETEVWADLTPKQKLFVDAFIKNGGDKVASVQAAYDVKNERSAKVLSYQVFENRRVIAALAAYFQSDPLESFKAEVRRAYQKKKLTVAQVNAMKLQADLNGWGSASLPNLHGHDKKPSTEPVSDPTFMSEPPTPRKFHVGERITERDSDGVEHVGVIRSLDSAGYPLIVDEVTA